MPEQQFPEFVKEDPKLEQALSQVRGSHEEAAKFALNPVQYLQDRGVDTRGLKVEVPDPELSDAELEKVAGGQTVEEQLSICGSVGCVGCISVGDEVME